ncbi:hypothetical protein [Nonomuraea sp. 10N515B]|uniref:hypothetical protein n=1 Tax=Nonomuraea sp. 10N515B TaxID=3457422 RepID=UPI003FCE103B
MTRCRAKSAVVSAGVATDPLASSQAAAAEIATFWLSGGGANLAAATPPYFDGELAAVYSAASTHWSGAVLPR